MSPITIVTGNPASGKSTLCRLWASTFRLAVHLRLDHFYEGLAHPLLPTASEAQFQDITITQAFCRAAATYAEAGYAVFLDGIIEPRLFPVVREELACPLHYVVLRCGLEEALLRNEHREEFIPRAFVRAFHSRFRDVGPHESHAVETGTGTPEDVLETLQVRWERGDFLLPPGPMTGG